MQFANGGRIDGPTVWADSDLSGCYIPYRHRDKRAREILAQINAIEGNNLSQFRHVDIARVCHEANRAVQIATSDPAVSPAWDDAPEWQRASAVEGVEKALAGSTPEQLHESWCDFKVTDGWRYGPAKDADAKTHPCLVPYDELPAEQKAKDALFGAIVNALGGAV